MTKLELMGGETDKLTNGKVLFSPGKVAQIIDSILDPDIISVKDRLPEKGTWVWARHNTHGWRPRLYSDRSADGKRVYGRVGFISDKIGNLYNNKSITHWAFLNGNSKIW